MIDLSPNAKIISASRRTDIPAFYATWMMNRLRAGFAETVNPFNARQVMRVSLRPQDVIAIVFWTRHPQPLLRHLDELLDRGYRFYFQWTFNRFPRVLEQTGPAPEKVIDLMHQVAERLSPGHIQWRYDPIILSEAMSPQWHVENFAFLAERVKGATRRCYVSFLDFYKKTRKNLEPLNGPFRVKEPTLQQQIDLMRKLQKIAQSNNIELYACCEDHLLEIPGVRKARCVDVEVIHELYPEVAVIRRKLATRTQCGCYESKDIGAYDSCLFRCIYCYANADFHKRSLPRYKKHQPVFSRLIP